MNMLGDRSASIVPSEQVRWNFLEFEFSLAHEVKHTIVRCGVKAIGMGFPGDSLRVSGLQSSCVLDDPTVTTALYSLQGSCALFGLVYATSLSASALIVKFAAALLQFPTTTCNLHCCASRIQ